MNKNEVYSRATKLWGKKEQLIQAIEELSELTKAICKHINRGGEITPILEETADVEIMCEQIRHMFKADAAVDTEKAFKLNRLSNKLDETEKKLQAQLE